MYETFRNFAGSILDLSFGSFAEYFDQAPVISAILRADYVRITSRIDDIPVDRLIETGVLINTTSDDFTSSFAVVTSPFALWKWASDGKPDKPILKQLVSRCIQPSIAASESAFEQRVFCLQGILLLTAAKEAKPLSEFYQRGDLRPIITKDFNTDVVFHQVEASHLHMLSEWHFTACKKELRDLTEKDVPDGKLTIAYFGGSQPGCDILLIDRRHSKPAIIGFELKYRARTMKAQYSSFRKEIQACLKSCY